MGERRLNPPANAFESDARAYQEYLASPLGRLRVELAWLFLSQALARLESPADRPLRVLDVGGGAGELAVRLAEQGHRVVLLDSSPAMVELARARRAALVPEAQARLDLHLARAEEVAALFPPAAFDAALCHSVLEYVDDPTPVLNALCAVLRPGGLASVFVSNREGQALRLSAVGRNLPAARAALTARVFPTALFGGKQRAYSAAELRRLLRRHGLDPRIERGVRIFADFLPPAYLEDPALAQQVRQLEVAAAGKLPHRRLARYLQVLALKQQSPL